MLSEGPPQVGQWLTRWKDLCCWWGWVWWWHARQSSNPCLGWWSGRWEALEGRSPQLVWDEHLSLIWGLDLRLIGRCRSQEVAQCGWFVELGVMSVGWPCSIRVPGAGRSGRWGCHRKEKGTSWPSGGWRQQRQGCWGKDGPGEHCRMLARRR